MHTGPAADLHVGLRVPLLGVDEARELEGGREPGGLP